MHDFTQKLEYSLGEHEKFDIDILKRIYHYADVVKTNVEIDKTGIDYIATLRSGATINIDAKTREKGASQFWKHGEPELALEVWSVVKTKTYPGKIGWTLSESTNVDYILYTFDKSDCNKFFYLPFQMLRTSFKNRIEEWRDQYGIKPQSSNRWQSKAIFVPASVVIAEINKQMTGTMFYQDSA